MGRKIEIKKIEEITKRQVTFSKRRTSLLKKVEEIAICCDVDVLFVAFSPANRLTKFCSQKRIEDMLHRYIKLPVERRLTHMANVQEKVAKLRQLNNIRGDVSKLHFLDKQIENLELRIKKSTLELQIVDANIRDYELTPEQEPSLHQLNWCERNLQLSLQKVMARKLELEKQGKMDVHFAAQQTAPQQFDTNNWINPYSSSIQGSIYQDWMDKGKRVANNSSNYTYTSSFASSSQSGNIPFSQIQNSLRYIPWQSQQQNMVVDIQQNPTQTIGQSQSQQQNMVVDVQQNPAQTFVQSQSQQQNMVVDVQQNPAQIFGQSQSQQQNMVVDVQQNPAQTFGQSSSQQQNIIVNVQQNPTQTFGQLQSQQLNMVIDNQQNSAQTFGQSQAQVNFGESSDNSLVSFWQNVCASTRPISSPLVTTSTQLNNPSQLGLEYANSTWNNNFNNPSQLGLENAHSNWNDNFNNNNNHIIQHNDHSSVRSDAIAPNVNGFNYSIEENTMGCNEYFVENTLENDAWEWDDAFLNEAFNGEDF